LADHFPPPRLILGLLGGIASGKSTVAAAIVRWADARVVDADALARVALDECAKDGRLQAVLGPKALLPDGTPDRRAIAAKVFKDSRALRDLERVTHPFVHAQIDDAVEEHRSGRGPSLLVLDVPLLLETGLERRCDALWFVEVPDADRFARAEKRLGLSPDDVRAREEAQSPLDRKKARSDLVIRNDGDPESTEAQVKKGLEGLGISLRRT
jgi:dephospho-CoA kinase